MAKLKSKKFKEELEKREIELSKVIDRLDLLEMINGMIENDATGEDIFEKVRDPKFPHLLLEDINLEELKKIRLNDLASNKALILRSRIKEFIERYHGSKSYIENKIISLKKSITEIKL